MNGIIVGVDPGAEGGIATLHGEELSVVPMPWLPTQGIETEAVRHLFMAADHVVIEDISVRPGQSVVAVKTSCANWGRLVGIAEGLSCPLTIVRPQEWQRVVLAGRTKGDRKARKAASVAVAQRLWPACTFLPSERAKKPSDGMAEAALIAEWARRTL